MANESNLFSEINKVNPGNKVAFSGEEIKSFKENISKLHFDAGIVVDTPPEIYDVIGRVYPDENILIKSIKNVGDNTYELLINFGTYALSKNAPSHVSGIQMMLAEYQAMFTAIGLSINDGSIDTTLSYDVYLSNLYNVLHVATDNLRRVKLVLPGEDAYLKVKIVKYLKRNNLHIIKCEFIKDENCFLHGEEMCVLQDRFVNP